MIEMAGVIRGLRAGDGGRGVFVRGRAVPGE